MSLPSGKGERKFVSPLTQNFLFPSERKKAAPPAPSTKESPLARQHRLVAPNQDPKNFTTQAECASFDPLFEQDVEALGYLLFRSPVAIEEQVKMWFGRIHNQYVNDPIENIKSILNTVSTTRPYLVFRIKPVNDYRNHPLKRICNISFVNTMFIHKPTENYYGCDDELLIAAMNRAPTNENLTRDQESSVNESRMAIVVSSLSLHNLNGRFMQEHTSEAGSRTTILSAFGANAILDRVFNKSLFIVAMLRYILHYCDEMLVDSDATDNHTETDAKSETAIQLLEMCNAFVSDIGNRQTTFSTIDNLIPDELLVYRPGVCDDHFIFGIPYELVCNGTATQILIWLQHFWADQRASQTTDPLATYDDSDNGVDQDQSNNEHGYRRLIDNLWNALAVSSAIDVEDFFDVWDTEHLVPILKYMNKGMSAVSNTV